MKLLVTKAVKLSRYFGALLLVLMSGAAAQTTAAGAGVVRNLEVLRDGNDTRVEVTLSAAVNPSVEIATQPDRLVLVLPNTVSGARQRRVRVNDNGLRRVRMGLNSANPPVTRVIVDLDGARPYTLTPEGNKVTLTVRPALPSTSRSGLGVGGARSEASAQLSEAAPRRHQVSPSGASNALATLTSKTVIAS